MARVFISHAGEDLEEAARLRGWLVEEGHDVFLDRDLRDGILAGEEWEERLHERLRWADATVCVLTAAYLRSVWCSAEVGIARWRGSRLIPVRAEPGVVHPLLRSVQYADLTRGPEAARAALTEALRRVDQLHGTGWADDRSPFPGLLPFDAGLHRVFFGRDADVAQLANTLRSPAARVDNPVLLLVGPSGCGKSSLLRAGLLPTMAGEPDWWTLAAFTPGVDPVAGLVRELALAAKALDITWEIDGLRDRVVGGQVVELVDTLLLAAPGARRKRLLVAVDQFEELLVQTPPEELTSFAAVLRALSAGPVSVVATMRPEFLDRVLGHPDLSSLSLATHTLRPLRREALRTVIEGPAGLAGITVADELTGLLVDDTAGGDALPLLAFTLEQLAEGVGRGGELSRSRYDALGGVQGALVRQANAALAAAATRRGEDAVLATLLRVVTVDEQNRPTRWHVRRADLSEDESAELDAFVARRLLTVDVVGGEAVIGASHEAFFTAWPALAAAIGRAATALRARRLVEDAATEWDAGDRPAEKLWERGQLAGAMTAMEVDVRARQVRVGKVHVSPRAREFLHASVRRDRFRRRRLVVTLSVLLVLAVVAAVVAFVQQRSAREQQRAAREQALISTSRLLDDKAEAVLATDPRAALMLSVAAQRIHRDADTSAMVSRVVTTTPYAGELRGVDAVVTSISFTPDGRRLAAGFSSGAVILWDVSEPLRPRMLGKPFIGFESSVTAVFSADGDRLVTAGSNGAVALWDLTDPEHPRTMGTPLAGVEDVDGEVAISPDGTVLANTVKGIPGFRLWDLTDPAHVRPLGTPLAVHPEDIIGLAFSPDGTKIAASSPADLPVGLWDITQRSSPRLLSTITPDPRDVSDSPSFSADGTQLALGGAFQGTALWDITDPANPRQARDRLRGTSSSRVFFASREPVLATTGGDDGLLLWDVDNPDFPFQIERLATHRNDRVAAFSPDGSMVASGSLDGVITLWNLHRQGRPRLVAPPVVGHRGGDLEEIYALAATADVTMIATGGRDSTVELWDVADPARPRLLGKPLTEHVGEREGVTDVAFSPDGGLLVTGGADERVVLWDLDDPAHPRKLPRELSGLDGSAQAMVFSPDGRTLTVGTDDKTKAWDLRDPERPRVRATVFDDEGVMGIWRVRDGRVLALLKGSGQYTTSSGLPAPTTETTEAEDGAAGGGESSAGPVEGGPGEPTGTRLWDITDPAHPRQLGRGLTGHAEDVATATMSPDGRLLAVTDRSGSGILWDISEPEKARRLGDPLTPHGSNSAFAVAFPPQGGVMATGGIGGEVYLWDIGDPAEPRMLGPGISDNLDAVGILRFSADGTRLVSAGSDGDVVFWDMTPFHDLRRDPAARACEITDQALDRETWTRNAGDLPYQDTCA